MEEIARVAAMSKKNLYELYPDKKHLLAAVLVSADDFPWKDDDDSIRDDLLEELRHRLWIVIEFALSPRQVRLTRLIISEAEHFPNLVHEFHKHVITNSMLYLAEILDRIRQQGFGPNIEDIQHFTDALFWAAMGDLHVCALLGKHDRINQARIMAQIDFALQIFGFQK